MTALDDIESALQYVDAHDRNTWVSVGMAIKSELGNEGFSAWDDWSKTAQNYRAKDAAAVWRSFKGGRTSIGTLYWLARNNGWQRTGSCDSEEARAARRASAERVAREAAEAERRQEQAWRRAEIRAQELMKVARPGEHPYMAFKGIKSPGLVIPIGVPLIWSNETRRLEPIDQPALLVPMRNVRTNEIQGAQLIWFDSISRTYEKKFLPGMRSKGAIFRIGPQRPQRIWLVEGFATGHSVLMAAGMMGLQDAVIVCFSDGNLVHVAEETRGHRIVFADNDESGAGERAAKETGLPYIMAPTTGDDANDLHKSSGIYALADLMSGVVRARV